MDKIDQAQNGLILLNKSTMAGELMDDVAYILRRKNPNTGETLKVRDQVDPQKMVDPTLDQVKAEVALTCRRARGYSDGINAFLAKFTEAEINACLSIFGLTEADVKAKADGVTSESTYVELGLNSVTGEAGLVALANHADANMPKTTRFKRTWPLADKR